MIKPNDYDSTTANGNYVPLEAGGYICKIMGLTEGTTGNGADAIYISLDIAEGKESGRFAREFRADSRQQKKWGCIYTQLVHKNDGSTNPFFKGVITSIEQSNGFTVNWSNDPAVFSNQFKNKLVGVVFAREQYEKQDGTLAWSTKPVQFHTVEAIRKGDFKIPEDKPYINNSAPAAPNPQSTYIPAQYLPPQNGNLSDNDLPF